MIQVQGLTMRYGSFLAVDHVSFGVKKNEIIGLLGPNGAGKSTIMKILTTYLSKTSGKVVVNGMDVDEDPISIRRSIGYLPENAPLYMDMEVSAYLDFVASSRGLSGTKRAERIQWVVDACDLKAVFKRPIFEASKGFRQRIGLAQALIHDPQILILDEPTSGLDPLQIVGIRSLIKELSKTKTIIFSTHILQEASAISDRMVIINEGKVIAEGTVPELEKKAMKENRCLLSLAANPDEVVEELKKIQNVQRVRHTGSDKDIHHFSVRHSFDVDIWQDLDRLIKSKNWPLKAFTDDKISMEETFIQLNRDATGKGGKA